MTSLANRFDACVCGCSGVHVHATKSKSQLAFEVVCDGCEETVRALTDEQALSCLAVLAATEVVAPAPTVEEILDMLEPHPWGSPKQNREMWEVTFLAHTNCDHCVRLAYQAAARARADGDTTGSCTVDEHQAAVHQIQHTVLI